MLRTLGGHSPGKLGEGTLLEHAEALTASSRARGDEGRSPVRQPRPPIGRRPHRGKVNVTDPDWRMSRRRAATCRATTPRASATSTGLSSPPNSTRTRPTSATSNRWSGRRARAHRRRGERDHGWWSPMPATDPTTTSTSSPAAASPSWSRRMPASAKGHGRAGTAPATHSCAECSRPTPGRELYGRRQVTIEPVFANTRFNRWIDRFSRRGISACRSESRLITATHNLLKLHRHQIITTGACGVARRRRRAGYTTLGTQAHGP